MQILELTKSIGRTGNCMLCIINAVYYAIQSGIEKVQFPTMKWQCGSLLPGGKYQLLNSSEIDIHYDESDSLKHHKCARFRWNKEKNQYESWFHMFYNSSVTFENRSLIAQKYILPLFCISPKELTDNDLVIHLRSGDVLGGGHSSAYIQPPLSFYLEVIEKRHWDTIYILTETRNNPVLSALVERYPQVVHFLDDNKDTRNKHNGFHFHKDIEYMVGAKHFIASNTSLAPLMIQMNKGLVSAHFPSYFFKPRGFHVVPEMRIWWSNTFYGKKEDFVLGNGVQCCIYNYDEYTNTPKDIYKYYIPENREYLMNWKRNVV